MNVRQIRRDQKLDSSYPEPALVDKEHCLTITHLKLCGEEQAFVSRTITPKVVDFPAGFTWL
jgi:hypothetical protein